ncbi:MAG: hypothetical protein J0L84_18405, partial [Verrucomicrobia bacterium]|nr:hypothetical protein [Verrucomicrobiota bacterium]
GSPGCVGPKVGWAKAGSEDMNLNLCELRNLDLDIARAEGVAFADVFWPMFTLAAQATTQYGPSYALAGKDGVHPGWAGQVVMAAAFLKALGLDGDLGAFTVDWASQQAAASAGHEVLSSKPGEWTFQSSRYPFCAPPGDLKDDNAIRSGMALVDFHNRFNRLRLVVTGAPAGRYDVTWGGATRTFTAEQLAAGILLPAEFATTPFDDAFKRVDEAVARKQAYETKQIKSLFHGEEGQTDMEATVALTERARAPLAAAIPASQTPVTHTLRITAQP